MYSMLFHVVYLCFLYAHVPAWRKKSWGAWLYRYMTLKHFYRSWHRDWRNTISLPLPLSLPLLCVSKASDTAFPALIKSDERFECRLMNKLNKFKTSLVNDGAGNTLPRVFRILRHFGICAQTGNGLRVGVDPSVFFFIFEGVCWHTTPSIQIPLELY